MGPDGDAAARGLRTEAGVRTRTNEIEGDHRDGGQQPLDERIRARLALRYAHIAAAELANGRVIHQEVAQTTTGRVSGHVEPLQPAERWTGVYPASAFGPVFSQSYDKTEPSSLYFQDEDCLRRDVWIPAVDDAIGFDYISMSP